MDAQVGKGQHHIETTLGGAAMSFAMGGAMGLGFGGLMAGISHVGAKLVEPTFKLTSRMVRASHYSNLPLFTKARGSFKALSDANAKDAATNEFVYDLSRSLGGEDGILKAREEGEAAGIEKNGLASVGLLKHYGLTYKDLNAKMKQIADKAEAEGKILTPEEIDLELLEHLKKEGTRKSDTLRKEAKNSSEADQLELQATLEEADADLSEELVLERAHKINPEAIKAKAAINRYKDNVSKAEKKLNTQIEKYKKALKNREALLEKGGDLANVQRLSESIANTKSKIDAAKEKVTAAKEALAKAEKTAKDPSTPNLNRVRKRIKTVVNSNERKVFKTMLLYDKK
jgi:hypothetical protein